LISSEVVKKNSVSFVELEISSPFSQEFSTRLYAEPHKMSPCYRYLFKVNFNIINAPAGTHLSQIFILRMAYTYSRSVFQFFRINSTNPTYTYYKKTQVLLLDVLVVDLISFNVSDISASVTLSSNGMWG
jgi:hypothetical protein